MKITYYNEDEYFHTLWESIIAAMKYVSSEKHFWTDEEKILCDTEGRCEAVADFLEELGYECCTGYYDPAEDKHDGMEDKYTGWYYIDMN